MFILPKDGQPAGDSGQIHLQSTLATICQNLSPTRDEPGVSVQQLVIALYLFPTTASSPLYF